MEKFQKMKNKKFLQYTENHNEKQISNLETVKKNMPNTGRKKLQYTKKIYNIREISAKKQIITIYWRR